MKRVLNKVVRRSLSSRGYSSYMSSLMIRDIKTDIFNKEILLINKLWAWRKGFFATKAKGYGINESNYKNHMPHFDYYKLHPLNEYSNWIDDKITLKYILAPFKEYMPKYYFLIKNNQVIKLMDCPTSIDTNVNGIIQLLKKEQKIAIKLISGSLGAGFYKLIYSEDRFYVNSEEKTLAEIKDLILSLEGYLVTEYLISHESIRRIFDVTPNTLRVQMIRDQGKKPEIVGAFIRFGTKKTGVLETPTVGGIIAGVNIKNGAVYNPVMFQGDSLISLDKHPDTNESFDITLPYWSHINQKLFEISDYLPSLSYLGFDIIITDNTFKIIEINSLTSPTVLSYYYLFFKNNYAKEYFLRKFKQKPKNFQRVIKMLES